MREAALRHMTEIGNSMVIYNSYRRRPIVTYSEKRKGTQYTCSYEEVEGIAANWIADHCNVTDNITMCTVAVPRNARRLITSGKHCKNKKEQ